MWCIQKPHDKMSQITMVSANHFTLSRNNKDIYKGGKNDTWSHNHTDFLGYITTFGNESLTKYKVWTKKKKGKTVDLQCPQTGVLHS